MSKQLKYQLKKTLKKAEFVQADLEYHEELTGEAKLLFLEEVSLMFAALAPETRMELNRKLEAKEAAALAAAAAVADQKEQSENAAANNPAVDPGTDLECSEHVSEEEDTKEDTQNIKLKSPELKKLFRKIAELTHPDKILAKGASEEEAAVGEKIFKKAKEALDRENWFVLYTIAIELGIEIEKESESYIHWIEQDIENTMKIIEQMSNKTYWHWYIATDNKRKKKALYHYFLQVYGFLYPNL